MKIAQLRPLKQPSTHQKFASGNISVTIDTLSVNKNTKKLLQQSKLAKDEVEETIAQDITNLEVANLSNGEASNAATGQTSEVTTASQAAGESAASGLSNGLLIGMGVLGAAGLTALAASGGSSNGSSTEQASTNTANTQIVTTTRAATETTIKTPPTLSLSHFVDTGSSQLDNITRDNSFRLALSEIATDAQVVYQKLNAADNTWVSQNDAAFADLADGEYSFRALITNADGLEMTTNTIQVTVDTVVYKTYPNEAEIVYSDTGEISVTLPIHENEYIEQANAGLSIFYEIRRTVDNIDFWSPEGTAERYDSGFSWNRAIATDLAGNQDKALVFQREITPIMEQPPSVDDAAISFVGDNGRFFSGIYVNKDDYTVGFRLPWMEAIMNRQYDENGLLLETKKIYEAHRSADGGLTWESFDLYSSTTEPSALGFELAQENIPDSTYIYRFTRTDQLVSTGEIINEVNFSTKSVIIDTTADVGELLINHQVLNGATYNTEDGTLDLSLQFFEDKALFNFQVSTDNGTTWQTTTSSQTKLNDGDYLFRGQVADLAGNIGYTEALLVHVDHNLLNVALI